MVTRKTPRSAAEDDVPGTPNSVDALLLAALERGDDSLQTGRYLATFKDSALDDGLESLKSQGMRLADARDFDEQAMGLADIGDADAAVYPEIGVALITAPAAAERGLSAQLESAADSPIDIIEPEYFVFSLGAQDYLRGFMRAAETIARDLGSLPVDAPAEEELEAEVLGATWGLKACKVPTGTRSGSGIKVAVLDTGFDLGHPDFAGRPIVSRSFVGEAVQDLNGHGTHCVGTALGPRAPAGARPRYGIAWAGRIHVGKVLTNSGSGTMSGVLAGMNWAIASQCSVISMSLGAPIGVQAAYTAAGRQALARGCLIVAAAGNEGGPTGAPANSPSIFSVASLDPNLSPSSFSNFGKVEIAAPGRDIFSAWPRPTRYRTISGTSMATPHVAGCAALWAQTSAALRGQALWNRLQASAKPLPLPANRVGRGLVQAP